VEARIPSFSEVASSPWTACKFFRQLAARKEEEEELEEQGKRKNT
jgi:hypothetical protein